MRAAVAASALRCVRPVVHHVKSYRRYQARLSVQRRASESVCIFLHILRSSLLPCRIRKEFESVVHMYQKRHEYFVKYAPTNLKTRCPHGSTATGTFHTHEEKFQRGTPTRSALRSWVCCRLIVTGSGAQFCRICAASGISGGLGFKAAPVVIFLSGVPESVKSLYHNTQKTRGKRGVFGGLVFSW